MASVYALGEFLQRKNLLKNPNFVVIQGTASGTIANSLAIPTASLGYLGETEWWLAASGGTPAYAFSQLNENVTVTGAAGTTDIYLGQRIESRDANKLKSKTVTLSCELSNSLLTTVTWELFNPTTTNDVHGTVAVSTQTLIATGTFTVNSTLTRYSATIALPVGISRGLGIRFRVGAQTSGTWVVSRLQLEEGSLATNFSCGSYLEELKKCLRYSYCINASGSTLVFITGSCSLAGVDILSIVYLPEEMLDTPILIVSAAGDFSFGGIVGSPTAISNQAVTPNRRLALLLATGSFTGSPAINFRVNTVNGFMRFLSHIA